MKVKSDANICSTKWNEPDFKLKNIAEEIKGTLAQCGMNYLNLGHTYLADRLSDSDLPILSTLNHIYRSSDLDDSTEGFKLNDHVPIIIKISNKNFFYLRVLNKYMLLSHDLRLANDR